MNVYVFTIKINPVYQAMNQLSFFIQGAVVQDFHSTNQRPPGGFQTFRRVIFRQFPKRRIYALDFIL